MPLLLGCEVWPPRGIPAGLMEDDPPRIGRAMEEPPLAVAGTDLGVGETIPRGIPPGETERLAALAGDGARRPEAGGFKRDVVGVGCLRPDLSRRLESLVCDFSEGWGLRILESRAGLALGCGRPADCAARLGRLLLVTAEGGATPPPPPPPPRRAVPRPPRVAEEED